VTFRLDKRYSDGLFFLGSYQLSRSRDNGSGEIEANDTAYAWDLNADTAYARYDQRHRVQASFGYELPFGPGKPWLANGGAAAYALGGWQIQGIMRFASGFPFSVSSTNVCQCGSFIPQRVNLVTAGNFGELDAPTARPLVRQERVRGSSARHAGHRGPQHRSRPGTQQINMSLSKRFPINRARVEFRAEIFNLLNHNNFVNRDLTYYECDRRHINDGRRRPRRAIRV
jgi:hypothetical protein